MLDMTNNKLVCPETNREAQTYMVRQWLLHVAPALTLKSVTAQPTQRICVFCIDLTTNSDHFPRTTLTIFISGT
jgi:hypothetical protein